MGLLDAGVFNPAYNAQRGVSTSPTLNAFNIHQITPNLTHFANLLFNYKKEEGFIVTFSPWNINIYVGSILHYILYSLYTSSAKRTNYLT